jgi:fluoride exporter
MGFIHGISRKISTGYDQKMQTAWVGILGLLGVLCRYGVDRLFIAQTTSFPIGTFGINILGAFLAGVVYTLGSGKILISPEIQTGLMVGFLGGFTTFSAYCLQSVRLIESGKYSNAFIYLSVSPILGVAAVMAGIKLARALA